MLSLASTATLAASTRALQDRSRQRHDRYRSPTRWRTNNYRPTRLPRYRSRARAGLRLPSGVSPQLDSRAAPSAAPRSASPRPPPRKAQIGGLESTLLIL